MALWVVRKLIHHRSHDRASCSGGLEEQAVQVRDQAIAKLDGLAHDGQHLGVHPGLVDRAIIVPGVDRKARVEDAVLHPANEELHPRLGACKSAHIVTRVRRAGEAQTQPHGDIEAQRMPGSAVIARPGLGVALDAWRTGAGEQERALVGAAIQLRFAGCACHQHGVQRPDQTYRDRVAKAMAAGLVIPDRVLVIVVPGRVDPESQQAVEHTTFPPVIGRWIGEIDMCPVTAPKSAELRIVRNRLSV